MLSDNDSSNSFQSSMVKNRLPELQNISKSLQKKNGENNNREGLNLNFNRAFKSNQSSIYEEEQKEPNKPLRSRYLLAFNKSNSFDRSGKSD